MNRLIFIIFLSIGFSKIFAFPPPAPSAGVIEREIQKDYEVNPLEQKKEVPSLKVEIPEEKLQVPDGQTVFISRVKIKSECFTTEEIFKKIKKEFHGEKSLKEIYQFCALIEDFYAKEGFFLARAYPPVQKIENGVLIIEVIEGKLGSVTILGNKHYSTSFILKYFKHLQNRPLSYDEFMRSLILLNENNDLIAGAVFEKGKEFGFADVILRIKDERPVHLYLNSNDYGQKLLTNFRAGARLNGGNILTNGDKFMMTQVIGFPIDALYFTNLTYSIPLNARGTFLEGEYLYSKFHIEELTKLHIRGISEIGTIKLTHAFLRKRYLSIDGFSIFDIKQIQNFVLSQRTSYDKLRVLSIGFNLDNFGNYGRDCFNLRASVGIPQIFGGLNTVDKRSSRWGAGGLFVRFNADYDHLHSLPWSTFFFFHTSCQLSPYKLTLPEQIYIGGAESIRGYTVASYLGDSGYYFNLEYRFPLPFISDKRFFFSKKNWREHFQMIAFLDQGGVFLSSEKKVYPRYEKNIYLWGGGFGFRVKGPYNFDLSYDLGFPINHKEKNKDPISYFKLTWNLF